MLMTLYPLYTLKSSRESECEAVIGELFAQVEMCSTIVTVRLERHGGVLSTTIEKGSLCMAQLSHVLIAVIQTIRTLPMSTSFIINGKTFHHDMTICLFSTDLYCWSLGWDLKVKAIDIKSYGILADFWCCESNQFTKLPSLTVHCQFIEHSRSLTIQFNKCTFYQSKMYFITA